MIKKSFVVLLVGLQFLLLACSSQEVVKKDIEEKKLAEELDELTTEEYAEQLDRDIKEAEAIADEAYQTRRKKLHDHAKSSFGFDYGFNDFSAYDYNTSTNANNPDPQFFYKDGFAVSGYYYPYSSYSFGRLGFGAQFAVHGARKGEGDDSFARYQRVFPTFQTFGPRAVYEFNYKPASIVVPYASLGYDMVRQSYRIDDSTTDALGNRTGIVSGVKRVVGSFLFIGGALLNMSFLEPSAASDAYKSGIKKINLAVYYQYRLSTTSDLSAGTFYTGLRFEL